MPGRINRFPVDDALIARINAGPVPADLVTCPVCGDDVVIHEWLGITADNSVIDCDRKD